MVIERVGHVIVLHIHIICRLWRHCIHAADDIKTGRALIAVKGIIIDTGDLIGYLMQGLKCFFFFIIGGILIQRFLVIEGDTAA